MNELYAMIENGVITNLITWNGNSDPSTGGWQPPDSVTMVKLDPPPQIGWTATQGSDGAWTFSAPQTQGLQSA